MRTPKNETALLKTTPTWRTARLAIFTALSAVGSLLKIPSPVGSLAFDSCPGFFVALLFGPLEGALVCGLGHLATAAVSGFPLGVLHVPIAVGMALAGVCIGSINKIKRWITFQKWGFLPALSIGVIINTVLVFPLVPWLGENINTGLAVALLYVPFLFAAAVLNAVVAGLVYVGIRGKLKL